MLHGKPFPIAKEPIVKEPIAKASQIALFNRVFDEYLEEVTSKLPGYAVAVIIDGRIAPLLECVMAVDSGGRYFILTNGVLKLRDMLVCGVMPAF